MILFYSVPAAIVIPAGPACGFRATFSEVCDWVEITTRRQTWQDVAAWQDKME